jgi:hypothetical protein
MPLKRPLILRTNVNILSYCISSLGRLFCLLVYKLLLPSLQDRENNFIGCIMLENKPAWHSFPVAVSYPTK